MDDCNCEDVFRHGSHSKMEHRDGMVSRCKMCSAPGHYASRHQEWEKTVISLDTIDVQTVGNKVTIEHYISPILNELISIIYAAKKYTRHVLLSTVAMYETNIYGGFHFVLSGDDRG